MNELFDQGIQQRLIAFDHEQKNIIYIKQNKRLRYNNPEEKVRADAEAQTELESAKRRFEAILLGEAV